MNLFLRKQFNWFDCFSHLFQSSNTYNNQFCSQLFSFFYKQIEDESFMSAFYSSCDSCFFVSSAIVWLRQNKYQQAYMKHQSLQFQCYFQRKQQANQSFYQQIRKFQQNYYLQSQFQQQNYATEQQVQFSFSVFWWYFNLFLT